MEEIVKAIKELGAAAATLEQSTANIWDVKRRIEAGEITPGMKDQLAWYLEGFNNDLLALLMASIQVTVAASIPNGMTAETAAQLFAITPTNN